MNSAADTDDLIALRTRCRDCARDMTKLGHWFMVHDHVWAASGLGPEDGVLCLACLQGRIGRWLRADDFRLTDDNNRDSWGRRADAAARLARPVVMSSRGHLVASESTEALARSERWSCDDVVRPHLVTPLAARDDAV